VLIRKSVIAFQFRQKEHLGLHQIHTSGETMRAWRASPSELGKFSKYNVGKLANFRPI